MDKTSDILKSWKEIARHLDCGIRTAQRWERDLALPVHRPHGHPRSAVLAVAQELDQWVKTRSVSAIAVEVSADTLPDAMVKLIEHLEPQIGCVPCHLDVKLTLRLGDNGPQPGSGKDGDGRAIASPSIQRAGL